MHILYESSFVRCLQQEKSEIYRERLGFRADANCDYEVHWGINDQYRICFVWSDAGPKDVEIVDYH